jgi:hypothetical protein
MNRKEIMQKPVTELDEEELAEGLKQVHENLEQKIGEKA